MLQRAARNAYSWWWASHVRTKQSKWLEQSIQDMEEKVAETLKIIDDNGDSFAQRAEMYYRKRPELVSFVEESFRAYRALAERYDHLSHELQSANRTLATVFPDQVQYRMDDNEDDDDNEENVPGTDSSSSPDPNNQTPNPGIPKVPGIPKKNFRSPSMLLSRKGPLRRSANTAKSVPTTPRSGLSKDEALAEIDKLQKEILALQTEKEFVRSLYESSYEKYWEIEDQITGMQKRVGSLQDEFHVSTVIEDNDARALMATTALNSCKEALAKLQEIQAKSSDEAKAAYERVKEAHEKFETLRDQFISKHKSQEDQVDGDKSETESIGTKPESIEEEMAVLEEESRETHDVGLLREKIKEQLEQDSGNSSLTVTEMAEKIDELVNKVVTLETVVSSQTGLIKSLRSETDELQAKIRRLEEDKEMLIEDSENTKKKLKQLEEELRRVKILNQSVKCQDNSLRTHFTEASCNLEHLSGRLNDVKPDEESEKHVDNLATMKEDDTASLGDFRNEDNKSKDINFMPGKIQKLILQDKDDLSETMSNLDIESQDLGTRDEDAQPNWRQMFISGSDDREKILLEEYASVLRNYKDVRGKLNDVEKRNRDSICELELQVDELKNAVATKDKELHILHQKLTCSETTNPNESPNTTLTEYKYTPREALLGNAAEEANMQDPENSSSSLLANVLGLRNWQVENKGNFGMSPGNVKVRLNLVGSRPVLSTLEKKFRSDIDDLLEENLEFWLRFSTSVHQIQKFQNAIQDLQSEIRQIKETNWPEGDSNSKHHSLQSELKPIFSHLREIRTELSLWLEHSAVLQDELQGRHPTLCSIQDEIARAANPASATKEAELSGYQAAKFQGEVLNMKQENHKVSSELQAGLSFVKGLKNEVEKMLEELSQEIGVDNHSPAQPQIKHSTSRGRIPLRSFLFGVKLKRQKHSNSQKHHSSDRAATDNAPI